MLTGIKIGLFLLAGLMFVLVLPQPTRAVPLQATPPTLSRAFSPSTIGPGSATLLTYTLTNGMDLVASIAFTDTLPADIVLADATVETTDCTNGGVTAEAGVIKLITARLEVNEICTVTLYVVGNNTTAALNNLTLTSDAGNYTDSSPPTLTIDTGLPGFSKSFSPSSIPPAGQSTLTFTIDNSANGSSEPLSFDDTLPDGLVIADPPNITHDCVAGTFTATSGESTIEFESGAILANSICTLNVDVTSDTYGTYDNVSGELYVSSTSSGLATAQLNVPKNFLVKSFSEDPASPGKTTSLRFEIHNLHRSNGASNIAFSDVLDANLTGLTLVSDASNVCNGSGSVTGAGTGTLNFSGGSLPPGDSLDPTIGTCVFTITLQVPAGASPASYLNTTTAPTFDRVGSETESAATDYLIISPAPVMTKSFTDDPTIPGSTVTLEFKITNPNQALAMTDVAFTDSLPTILATMSSASVSNSCGGTATFSQLVNPPDPSGSVIPAKVQLSGGSLLAGNSCVVSLELNVSIDAASGSYTNTSDNPTAIVSGNTVPSTGFVATDDLLVVAAPDFRKTFTPTTVLPGGTVDLVFELEHSAEISSDATNIAFTDDLTFLSGLTATGLPQNDVCGSGSQISGTTNLSFSGGTLSSGSSCVFTVTLQVPGTASAGIYNNTASDVTATVSGLSTTGAGASADLTVTKLTFSKEFIGDPVIPGDVVTLTFTLDNTAGTADATITSFSDNLSSVVSGLSATLPPASDSCGGSFGASSTSLSYTGGSVLAGVSCTIVITLSVPTGIVDGSYPNTTGILYTSLGTVPAATDALEVEGEILSLTKSFIDDPVKAGDTVILEFTLENMHTINSTSDIAFSDNLDDVISGMTLVSDDASNVCNGSGSVTGSGTGTLSFANGSLAAGASCTFTATFQVPVAAADSIYVNTTSEVTGKITGLDVTGPTASANLQVGSLGFNKGFTTNNLKAGNTVVLTFTIANAYTQTEISDITFTDDLDAAMPGLIATDLPKLVCNGGTFSGNSTLTLTGGNLPTSTTCTFSATLQIPAVITPGTYINTTSELAIFGLGSAANPAVDSLIIVAPDMAITKTVVPTTTYVNEAVTFTLEFANLGDDTATGVSIIDTIPSNIINTSVVSSGTTITQIAAGYSWSVQDLAPGEGGIITITGTVDGSLSGDVTNTATITSVNDVTYILNNTDTVTFNVTVFDLAVSKSAERNNDELNGVITYTVTVINNGPNNSPDAMISDLVPSTVSNFTQWNCTSSSGISCPTASGSGAINETTGVFTANEQLIYTIRATLPSSDTIVTNTATVTTSLVNLGDSNLSNNSTTHISQPAGDIYLPIIFKDATFLPDLVIVDNIIANSSSITVVIKNQGIAAATNDFWVDVYFNPTQTPVLNKPWQSIAPAGAVWGVTQNLAAGEVLTLTVGGTYYDASKSSSSFPSGATVYGYVDSVNHTTTYGAVLELDESNNLSSAVMSTAGASGPISTGSRPISSERLPKR